MHLGTYLGFLNFTASKSQQNLEFIPVGINIANSARFRVISKLNLPFFLIFQISDVRPVKRRDSATVRPMILIHRRNIGRQCNRHAYLTRCLLKIID